LARVVFIRIYQISDLMEGLISGVMEDWGFENKVYSKACDQFKKA